MANDIAQSSEQPLIITRSKDGTVLGLRVNRPEVKNALSTPLLAEIARQLETAKQDEKVRVAVIYGAADFFIAGADINEFKEHTASSINEDPRKLYWPMIASFPKPLIAAVNGYCLGAGNELAMLCDIVIAGDNARFGQPEIKLGIIPGAGGTQRLTRTIGRAPATLMLMTGDMLGAESALQLGLVSMVVDAAKTDSTAEEIAVKIAAKSPLAVQGLKLAINASRCASLDQGLTIEREMFEDLFATNDFQKGLAAFFEKRESRRDKG